MARMIHDASHLFAFLRHKLAAYYKGSPATKIRSVT